MTKMEHLKLIDTILLDAWACAAGFWEAYPKEGNLAMSQIENAKRAIQGLQSQGNEGRKGERP